MVLRLSISPEAETRLKAKAAAAGVDMESYASSQLEAVAQRLTLEELSGPIGKAFEESGMTEDELAEFLEREKHAMRAERRASRPT